MGFQTKQAKNRTWTQASLWNSRKKEPMRPAEGLLTVTSFIDLFLLY